MHNTPASSVGEANTQIFAKVNSNLERDQL